MHITFVVPGPPVPKARARVVNGHSYTPKRTAAYERLVALHAQRERDYDLSVYAPLYTWPTDRRYALTVHVFVGNKRRSDVDNFLKAVSDALNGILWVDDSQVDEMHVFRAYDPGAPRMVVTVEVR